MKTIRHFTPFVVLVISSGIAQAQPADEPTSTEDQTEPTTPTPTQQPDMSDPMQPDEAPAPVQHQQYAPPPNVETNVYAPPAEPMDNRMWYMRAGFAISVGGGVDGFTGSEMRDATDVGGSWNARVAFGTHWPLALEASYIGSAQSINVFGLDNNAVLVGNGVQGALRVNVLQNEMIQPYLFAGAAWRHYSLTNNNFNRSDVRNSDNVFEVPIGGGFAYTWKQVVVDLRGEFRWSFNNDLVPRQFEGGDSKNPLDRWGVNLNFGYAF